MHVGMQSNPLKPLRKSNCGPLRSSPWLCLINFLVHRLLPAHRYNETLLNKLQDVTEKLSLMQAQSTELEATVRTEVAEEMAERCV